MGGSKRLTVPSHFRTAIPSAHFMLPICQSLSDAGKSEAEKMRVSRGLLLMSDRVPVATIGPVVPVAELTVLAGVLRFLVNPWRNA